MASGPNLLMLDCMKMLDMENTIPCSPAGMPMRSILPKSCQEICQRFRCSVTGSASLTRKSTMMAALMPLAMTVPHATPSTPIPITPVKSQSSRKLATVATSSE